MVSSAEIQLTLRDPVKRRSIDVMLFADPESTMDSVVEALEAHVSGPFFVNGTMLGGPTPLRESQLRNGAIVGVGKFPRSAEPHALEISIVGGPGAGRAVPFDTDVITIGRGPAVDVVLPDNALAREHFRIRQTGRGFMVEVPDVNHQVFVGADQVHHHREIALNEVIRAGTSLIEVRAEPHTDADLHYDERRRVVFNRPSRILPTVPVASINLPSKPSRQRKQTMPWITIIAPLVFSVIIATAFHSPIFLLMGLLSPVVAGASFYQQRRDNKRDQAEDQAAFDDAMKKVHAEVAKSAHWEGLGGRYLRPDAVTIRNIAELPRRRIWERRPHDDDFLTLRVGAFDRVASIQLENSFGENTIQKPFLRNDPLGVNLKKVGVIGVAGPAEEARAIGRWFVGQIAVLHSPNDVKIFVLSGAEDARSEGWEWTRWLPHVSGRNDPDAPFTFISSDRISREEHVKALLRMLAERKAAKERDQRVGADIVVVYDGIRALRNIAGIARLLKEGPELGIYAIALDSEVSRLPEETRSEIVMSGNRRGWGNVRTYGEPFVEGMIVDEVPTAWGDAIARNLAPIVAAGNDEDEMALPDAVRLVDLVNLDLDRVNDILVRWNTVGRTTRAPLGMAQDGPFFLDIKADGPHGLVAGTTGSGKSEFLQTFVVSLALLNRPDALNFLLIDYKGASAFADCADLPHTVGMVTNLDGHLTRRALVALDAELKRREHVLKNLHAADVDTAWSMDEKKAGEAGLAKLVIVIDEFAELVQELPDFVTGLIRVARVGRSLGVHLVLATQRPAGVVSAEMRANTGLRVGLRMEDKGDSQEVLDQGDASTISRHTPGRGYARLGGASILTAFQTARVAGRRPGLTEGLAPPVAIHVPWERVGRALQVVERKETAAGDTSDLHAIVSLVRKAAEEASAYVPSPPWLPALEATFVLPEDTSDGTNAVAYGIEDLPDQQRQPLARYSIEDGGHMLIIGSARSGRSTALRTLAASLAKHWSPNDLHIYGLDFGNGALQALTALPHTGVVAGRIEHERTERLVKRLLEEVARRQALLSKLGLGDIREQRSYAEKDTDRLPYILLLLDRWEGFLGEFPYESDSDVNDQLLRLLREGAGVGVRIVIAGDRNTLVGRMSSHIEERLIMHLSDKDDYNFANIPPRQVPDEMPPGRALRNNSLVDVQFGVFSDDASLPAQTTIIAQIGATARNRWPDALHNKPLSVDVLPAAISYEQASEYPSVAVEGHLTDNSVLVGVGGDELQAYFLDFHAEGPFFIIGGPAKSGRSTALHTIARGALQRGERVAAICPRRSPLLDIEHEGYLAFRSSEVLADSAALVSFVTADEGPVLVLIDDAEMVANSSLDDVLRALLAQLPNLSIVFAGTTEEMRNEIFGILSDARKTKMGMLMSPETSMDGDLVGIKMTRSMTGPTSPGRAYLCAHGNVVVVQIPLP